MLEAVRLRRTLPTADARRSVAWSAAPAGPAALWAALSTFAFYACGLVPLQVAAASKLGLSGAQASSMLCSVWLLGALATVALTLAYRQPLAIAWSTPALLYLVAMSGQFSFPELLGANLVAGLLIVGLGLTGVGGRLLAWLPLPLVMGMFAGSVLGDVSRMVSTTAADGAVAGGTVAGYLLGRRLRNPRVPPLGLAMLGGVLAVLITHQAGAAHPAWGPPTLLMPSMRVSVPAVLSVSLPLVVLSMGLGNVQGLGFLQAQGYRVPTTAATVAVGLTSAGSALFGGHPATCSRIGVAMLAGPEVGPPATRYRATLLLAPLMLLLALAANPVTTLLAALPPSFPVTLTGLALLASLQDALERAFGGPLRFGAMVAFVVAATPFTLAGLPAACWALVAALAASLATEDAELRRHWRTQAVSGRHLDRSGQRQAAVRMPAPLSHTAQRHRRTAAEGERVA